MGELYLGTKVGKCRRGELYLGTKVGKCRRGELYLQTKVGKCRKEELYTIYEQKWESVGRKTCIRSNR